MNEPETQAAPESPQVTLIQGKEAARLLKLAKRAQARKGSALGLMAAVANQLRAVHAIFARAAQDNTAITQQEVSLLLAFTKRLQHRAQELALAKLSGMREAAQVLEQTSRQLDEADRGGYGIRALQRQAQIDRRTLDRLRASVKARVQESAAVLAELEQAVDPVPGLRLVSGRARAKHAKRRKQAQMPPGITREQIATTPAEPTVTASQFLAALKPNQ